MLVHIVGPSGSGKSVVADGAAQQLCAEGIPAVVFNLGDCFRPFTYKAVTRLKWLTVSSGKNILLSRHGGRCWLQEKDMTEELSRTLMAMVSNTKLEFVRLGHSYRVIMDGHDVTGRMHDEIVDANVEAISKSEPARVAMLGLGEAAARQVICDCRVVVRIGRGYRPDAACRLLVTADDRVRARRVVLRRGGDPNDGAILGAVMAELRWRDERDQVTDLLYRFPGRYCVIDTTALTVEEQCARAYSHVARSLGALIGK